jgi:hypothetical protein
MNYYELYVLNTVLDGEDIYSVEPFSNKKMTGIAVEVIKDTLIETGFLKDYNTLTPRGVLVINRIKQFKEAKKYVRILNMTIGYVDNKLGVLLRTDPAGKYYFSLIDITITVATITDTFPELLLQEGKGSTGHTESCIGPESLLQKYEISAKTSFTLSTELRPLKEKALEGCRTKELFFESAGKKYCYDCNNSLLYEGDGNYLMDMLHKRLEVV